MYVGIVLFWEIVGNLRMICNGVYSGNRKEQV